MCGGSSRGECGASCVESWLMGDILVQISRSGALNCGDSLVVIL
jgi:hypothetical protein